MRSNASVAFRHLLVAVGAAFSIGCGGTTEQEKYPYGWHPVGEPFELPSLSAYVWINNDGAESVWQISAFAREDLRVQDCSRHVGSGCTVLACKEATIGVDTPWPYIPRTLGVATVTVGLDTFTIDGSTSGTAPLWTGTTNIGVVTEGGEVPPFQASLVAPDSVQLLAPELPPLGERLAIDWHAPLDLVWAGGASGENVRAAVTWSGFTKEWTYSVRAECAFDSGLGSGRIPEDVLEDVPTAEGLPGTKLAIVSVGEASVLAGDYAATVTAGNPARAASGELAIVALEAK